MPAHDDTEPTPPIPATPSVAEIERRLREGRSLNERGDFMDAMLAPMRDHLSYLPPAMVGMGEAVRETTERIRELATAMPNLDVVLPRAPEPGELSLVGGYSGVGRSMFGDMAIHTSPNVPEGTAYLVDRSAMQFNPRASLQLDRAGSVYGIERLPDEGDDNYRERITATLRRPVESPEGERDDMSVGAYTPNLFSRLFNNLRRQHGRDEQGTPLEESTPEPNPPIRFEELDYYDCYHCGVRGTRSELGLEDRSVRASGMCRPCYRSSQRQWRERPAHLPPHGHCVRCGLSEQELDSGLSGSGHCPGCSYHNSIKVMDDVLDSIDGTGPTIEELENTYRV